MGIVVPRRHFRLFQRTEHRLRPSAYASETADQEAFILDVERGVVMLDRPVRPRLATPEPSGDESSERVQRRRRSRLPTEDASVKGSDVQQYEAVGQRAIDQSLVVPSLTQMSPGTSTDSAERQADEVGARLAEQRSRPASRVLVRIRWGFTVLAS